MREDIIGLMISGLPGDLQTQWVGEKLRGYVSPLICKGTIYTSHEPGPDVLFTRSAGIWRRPCTWLQVSGQIVNFVIPEMYPQFKDVYISTVSDGKFRHVADSRELVQPNERLMTMIKSNYGV